MTNTYSIPTATDATRSLVAKATEALAKDATLTVEDALGLSVIPTDDGAKAVEDAKATLATATENAKTFARIRFDAVALAYSTERVGSGRMYPNQRALAKALGMTQPRVSQIVAAQRDAERVATVKATLRAAAKAGAVDTSIDGLSSVLHSIAKDGTSEDVAAAVATLTAGALPVAVTVVQAMDTDALVKAAERLLVLSGGLIDASTDRDAVARVGAMMAQANRNLAHAMGLPVAV